MPAGSKPGERRGGRAKGTPNKRTLEQKTELQASGLSPLDYLLSVVRDPAGTRFDRMIAAKAAAPYCHRALKSIEHLGPEGGAVQLEHEVIIKFD